MRACCTPDKYKGTNQKRCIRASFLLADCVWAFILHPYKRIGGSGSFGVSLVPVRWRCTPANKNIMIQCTWTCNPSTLALHYQTLFSWEMWSLLLINEQNNSPAPILTWDSGDFGNEFEHLLQLAVRLCTLPYLGLPSKPIYQDNRNICL